MSQDPAALDRLASDIAEMCSHWAMVLKLGGCKTREELVEMTRPLIRHKIATALIIQQVRSINPNNL